MTVLDVPLLVHPSHWCRLLCETPGTRCVLQHADGRKEYASGRLGQLLSDLLMVRLPVAPGAGPLIENVRRLIATGSAA